MRFARTVRVTAPAGTDITMPIEGREPHASSGLFIEKGQWGNLPTGEAYLAPLEGRSNGVVVVDGSMAGVGLVAAPIRIEVRDGFAAAIEGGAEAARLEALLAPHGQAARTVAEFGIGTNDRAILTGNILEDEKVMGTIHVAFGDNKSMGGSVRVASHLDGLVTRPSVWFDDTKIMADGRLLVD
jgi:aminopeptidase